jgi:hypothetical protein
MLLSLLSTSDMGGRWEGSLAQHALIISHSWSLISAGLDFANMPSCPWLAICMIRLPYECVLGGNGGFKL